MVYGMCSSFTVKIIVNTLLYICLFFTFSNSSFAQSQMFYGQGFLS